VGAYDLLQATYVNAILGEIASDNSLCGGESATDVIGWQQIDDMKHTPVNSNLRDIWNWMYAGVGRTNFILEFQDKIDFEGKDALIAEARFLRAYYYFELVKWFGDVESVFEIQYTDVEGASFDCLQCSEGNVAIGFSGIRNYSGPLFSSGFSFNVPTQEAYNAFDDNDLRKDIAILDIEAWAAQEGATFSIGFEHTGYFNRKYIPRVRKWFCNSWF